MEDYLRVVRAHDGAATWQLSCAADDAVVRLRPLSEGWVEVRRVDNSAVGAVPEACVARCDVRAAAYAFDAGEPWQLGLRVGAVVAELRDVGQGWSEVVDETGARGCVPGAYLGPPLDPEVSRLKEVSRSALAALALADDDATGGGGGWEVEDDFGGWRRYDAAAAAALDAAWARDGARGVVKFRSGNPDPCDYAVDLARMAQRNLRTGKLRYVRRGSGAPASPASPAPSADVAPAALAVDSPPLRRIDDVALVDRVEARAAAAAPLAAAAAAAARRRSAAAAAAPPAAAAAAAPLDAAAVEPRSSMSDVVFSSTKRAARPPGWKPPPPPRRETPAAMPPIDEAKSVAGPAGEYEALLRKVLADGLVHFQELGVVEDFERRRGLGAADRQRALSLFGWTPDEFRRSPAYGELLSLVLADGTVEAAERDLVASYEAERGIAPRERTRALQGLGWTDDDFARSGASPRAATPKRPASRTLPPRQPSSAARGGVVEYAVDELAAATDQWAAARRLGGGGFGDVFRGALRGGDVAIKRVHAQSLQGLREFEAEIRALGKLRDPSLVRLLGHGRRGAGDFCLVYELCDGGTLEDRLADTRNPLDWSGRVAAVRDAVRGLYYLHTQGDGEKCFIHGDVKTANILLTSAGGAKLADFGLVRELAKGATHVGTTSLTGSWGYICPAFARTGRVAPSTDVFAFGVVLLEVLTGLAAIDSDRTGAKDLVSHAGPGAAATMARLDAAVAAAPTARTAADLAWRCLEDDPSKRPSSEDVHDAIEELELEQSRQSFASRRPPSGATGRMLFGDEPATPRCRAPSASSPTTPRRRRRVRVLVGSFNMNGEGLDVSTLGSWLRHGTVLDDRGRRVLADLVVVGLQEAAKGRAFTALVGHLEAHLESHSAVPEASIGHTRMGMRLLVYARRDAGLAVSEVCKDAFTAGGIFKGALTASMLLAGDGFEERFVFTTAHLPAHEGKSHKRNAALARIRQRVAETMPAPASLFVFGDLNYRSNPALDLSVGVVTPQSVQRCVDAGDYAALQRVDELRRELDDGGSLATFASPPCRFPPTFKVAKKRGFFYLNSRLPSYTDRILYAASDAAEISPTEYDAAGDVCTSDHKPLRGCFEVALGGGDAADAAGGDRRRPAVDDVRHSVAMPRRPPPPPAASPRAEPPPPPPRPAEPPPTSPRGREFVVHVPRDARPNAILRVRLPNGTMLDVRVPPNVPPGGVVKVLDPTVPA